jgi:hypothetical protein
VTATALLDRLPELADLFDRLPAADRREVEEAWARALVTTPRRRPSGLSPLVRSHPAEEVADARARTLARGLLRRRELLGQSLSTAQVAARLGISPQAVTKRRQKAGLVAFRDRGDWRYPEWQFAGGGLLPGVVETWQMLPHLGDDVGWTGWFTLPARHLDGETPLALLQRGEAARVVDAASYVGGL